ncbi:Protein-L-isoaspartate O-methyltransferase [Anatilimnocola aggregata]|uniref:Protein-L-isoaspartate O-methyltransferase n=1 Tax=Anatilimnocola aggregata TaxID=2528021 RepID=A0A517YEK6_9BACT|nr:protein-L-isoaspartate(D-aspartate) O-methyltransferase [Anatilimnocola aggregata]QDU28648.1 Protein-L-isoaspartate O-methyltransferase [Anatilimnocola aggregata]
MRSVLLSRLSIALLALGCLLALVPGLAQAQTRLQFEKMRKSMVDEVIIGAGIKDQRVIDAMLATPRHEFVAVEHRKSAYLDMAIPIGDQQTISSPFIVAYMTQSLDPKPTDKVLEIGTGSGFQAAVLSPLVKEVYSIEIVEQLGKSAERTLKRLGYKNVFTKVGDGYLGWEEHAPFDKIIVTCSPEKVPQPLVDQLREGGLLVIPVGERYNQTLYLMRKKDGKLESEVLLPTLFVPMTGKAEDARLVKPDPANPSVVNGSFEEKAFEGGGQPGWYYEKQLTWDALPDAPDGKHAITFTNSRAGLSAHLLQGFGIDGRQVKQLEISGMITTKNVVADLKKDEAPLIAVTFYDGNRRPLGHHFVGPVLGDTAWHEIKRTIRVPENVREGILRIGLFGATGTASFDKIQFRKIDEK